MTKMSATIAHQVDGQNIDDFRGSVCYDPHTGIFTFEDGSKALAITKFEDSRPMLTASLSTMSLKKYKIWKLK